jgi:hypothetical protein
MYIGEYNLSLGNVMRTMRSPIIPVWVKIALFFLFFQNDFIELARHYEYNLLLVLCVYLGHIILIILIVKNLRPNKKSLLRCLSYTALLVLAINGTFSRVIDKLSFMFNPSDFSEIVAIGTKMNCYSSELDCGMASNPLIRVNNRIASVSYDGNHPVILVHSRGSTYFVFMPHHPTLPHFTNLGWNHFNCTEKMSDNWYLCQGYGE